MSQATNASDLPLLSRTPDSWAGAVIKDLLALLNDHAYLEKKAASNALELLNRWPEPDCPPDWVSTLAAIASDEAAHLSLVVRLLNRRGGRLERTHRNPYANALRALVRKGRGNEELVDRLLISALIEARSCERFRSPCPLLSRPRARPLLRAIKLIRVGSLHGLRASGWSCDV